MEDLRFFVVFYRKL